MIYYAARPQRYLRFTLLLLRPLRFFFLPSRKQFGLPFETFVQTSREVVNRSAAFLKTKLSRPPEGERGCPPSAEYFIYPMTAPSRSDRGGTGPVPVGEEADHLLHSGTLQFRKGNGGFDTVDFYTHNRLAESP